MDAAGGGANRGDGGLTGAYGEYGERDEGCVSIAQGMICLQKKNKRVECGIVWRTSGQMTCTAWLASEKTADRRTDRQTDRQAGQAGRQVEG